MRDWCFRPDCLERFEQAWPQAEVHRLADVGHWVVEDAPDEAARRFVEQIPQAATQTDSTRVARSASEAQPCLNPTHVRIAKAEHVFSAAHFITFDGHCERLHGHNYHVAAEVSGPLDENHLVVDFLAVRDALREIVAELDHYVLLPTEHPQIRSRRRRRDEVTATFDDRRWVFPSGDCRLLPVANTTAELLAAYIGRELKLALESRCGLEDPASARRARRMRRPAGDLGVAATLAAKLCPTGTSSQACRAYRPIFANGDAARSASRRRLPPASIASIATTAPCPTSTMPPSC